MQRSVPSVQSLLHSSGQQQQPHGGASGELNHAEGEAAEAEVVLDPNVVCDDLRLSYCDIPTLKASSTLLEDRACERARLRVCLNER